MGTLPDMGMSEFLFVGLALAWCGLSLFVIFDILRRPSAEFDAVGRNKWVWALSWLFFNLIAVVLYLAMARPDLEKRRLPAA